MTEDIKSHLDSLRDSGNLDFALESPKVVVKSSGGGGGSSGPKPEQPPTQKIRERRELANADPHLADGIETLVDYLVGSGSNIAPRNIPGTDAQLTAEDIAESKRLIETAPFDTVLSRFVKTALIDGDAFLEINWTEQQVFKPRLVPTEIVSIKRNEYGEEVGYEVENKGDGDAIELGKYDLAHLGFWKRPDKAFHESIIDRVKEQTDMLRDMEIDMARFVATKAYPPILWKLGSEDRRYNPSEIDSWLDEVSQVEPDSMLAAPHDVEAEAVGVDQNGSGGGALDLQPTFEHLESRIATGLGLPFFLLNGGGETTRNDSVSMMPAFDRRIQRMRGVIRDVVENQILRSIYYHPDPVDKEAELVPRFEFGSHSSEEERLEVDKAIKLFNQGFLTRQAFAQRVGIDPETEMPAIGELENNLLPLIQKLQGAGDNIQNPDGGSPTGTGGGADDSGGEATTRQNPERDSQDGRDKKPVEDAEQT